MSSFLSVPGSVSNHNHNSPNLRQSRSVPSSPVLQHRRQFSKSDSASSGSPHLSPTNSGPTTPYLNRRARTPEPRLGLALSLLESRDSKCSHCKGSPPSSVRSFSLSPFSSRKPKKKTPSYMRSTFAADKRRVRNSNAFSSESSSDDELEEKRSEFAAPLLLPPIWATDSGLSPSLKRRGDLDVLPAIRVSSSEELDKEFAKLETCRYLRKPNTNKST